MEGKYTVVKWSLSQLGQARREAQREVTCSMSIIGPIVSWKMLGQAHYSLLPSLLLSGSREEGSCAARRRRSLHLWGPAAGEFSFSV